MASSDTRLPGSLGRISAEPSARDEARVPRPSAAQAARRRDTKVAGAADPGRGDLGGGQARGGQMGRERVPVRTILTAIGLVLATLLLLWLIVQTRRVLMWVVVAAFFAVALYPVVNWAESRASWCRRSLATLVVFLLLVAVLGGTIALFAVPLAREGVQLAGQLPGLLQDTRAGRGPVGGLLARTHALEYIQNNQERIREFAAGLSTPALGFARGAATGVAGAVTVFVLAYLMVLQGPRSLRQA